MRRFLPASRFGSYLSLRAACPHFRGCASSRSAAHLTKGSHGVRQMTFGGLAVARMRRGGETVVSFTTGAGRGRRGAVLAVVAAMVGLAVAALPVAPAAAATSQTLVPWGDHLRQAQVPTGLSDVTAIAAGGDHGLLVHGDGTVGAWGSWDYGQNAVPAGLDHVVAVSAGWDHSLALKDDGTVVAWGDDSFGQTDVPAGLNNAVGISAGPRHNLAVRGDGTVVGWGENAQGETQPPVGLNNVTAVAVGAGHSLALKADGTVVAWGANGAGQATVPAGLDQVIAITAGGQGGPDSASNGYSLALRNDGTVVAWGANNYGQTNVPSGLSGVRSIDADFGYALALKADGTVVAWGTLVNGTTSVPDGLDHVTAIAAGGSDSIALVSGASTPLTTTACRDLSSCSTGWYGTEPVTGWWGQYPVNVTLYVYATAGSAVAKTVYTLDGSDPAISPTAITYTHPSDTLRGYVQLGDLSSTKTVRFFSIDAAGHIEPTRSQLIQIELVPPTTTISCNGGPCGNAAYSSAVTVALSATDAGGSGVASTIYTTDGSAPLPYSSSAKTYTGPFTVSSTTTVRYSSTDTAGNVEPGQFQLIQISKPPTTGSVVLTPTDDTYTAKGDPAAPHGAEATLKVNSGARERRTYMRFNLDAIPAGATGITVTLRLYASSDASASVRFAVSQVTTGWSEAALTWNTQPAVGTTVGTKGGLVGGAYNSVEVSGLVTGNGTYAMVVTDNSTAQRSFAAKESSLNKPPQLVVSWTNPG